jgi:hypothetical protein
MSIVVKLWGQVVIDRLAVLVQIAAPVSPYSNSTKSTYSILDAERIISTPRDNSRISSRTLESR